MAATREHTLRMRIFPFNIYSLSHATHAFYILKCDSLSMKLHSMQARPQVVTTLVSFIVVWIP